MDPYAPFMGAQEEGGEPSKAFLALLIGLPEGDRSLKVVELFLFLFEFTLYHTSVSYMSLSQRLEIRQRFWQNPRPCIPN